MERSWPVLRHCASFYLERLRQITITVRIGDIQSARQNLFVSRLNQWIVIWDIVLIIAYLRTVHHVAVSGNVVTAELSIDVHEIWYQLLTTGAYASFALCL